MKEDRVNSPSHYAGGGRQFEVIDVLEEWCGRASDPVQAALLFNCLKYLSRLYDKADNPIEDAKKSKWYLERLIDKMEAQTVPFEHFPSDFYEQLEATNWALSGDRFDGLGLGK